MNPNDMTFECHPGEFLELYRLIAQLPKGTIGGQELRKLKAVLPQGIASGHCNIYPLGRQEVSLEEITVPADGKLKRMSTTIENVPFLMFEYNHSTYAIFNRNPILPK